MRSLKSFLVSCCCCICAICLSIVTLASSVSADVYVGQTEVLTVAQTVSLFGEEMECLYWNGQEYASASFEYVDYKTGSDVFDVYCYDSSGYIGYSPSYNFLIYRANIRDLSNIHVNGSASDFTIKLSPSAFDFLSTNYCHCACGLGFTISQDYANVGIGSWEYLVDSVATSVDALPLSNGSQWQGGLGLLTPLGIGYNDLALYYKPIVLYNNNSTPFSLTSGNITFDYAYTFVDYEDPSSSATGVYFFVTTPTVSSDYVLNVPDDDDDDDTGLLTTIKNKIIQIFDTLSDLAGSIATAIINGIRSLFIPDTDDLEGLFQEFWDMLADTFGDVYSESSSIEHIYESIFDDTSGQDSIRFPGVSFRQYTIIPAQDVPLKPDGFSGLFDTLATVFDIICTIAFLNMIKHRFEKVVLENDG